MWDFYYNSFCAALASLTASFVYKLVAESTSETTKKRVVRGIVFGAGSGTIVLIVTMALPHHILPLRQLLLPTAAVEGDWIQEHNSLKLRYSTVHLAYDPTAGTFAISGHSASISDTPGPSVVTPRADWRSHSMSVQLVGDRFVAHYTFDAKMKEAPTTHVDGFGEITFDCRKGSSCNFGSGFYKDTKPAESVDFKLYRLCGDYERLMSQDPYALIKHYVQAPDKFRCTR